MTGWRELVEEEWKRNQAQEVAGAPFPLMERAFSALEILAAVESLLSGRLTMSDTVRGYEHRFAEMIGVPYAVMVNSGSSANLLAVAAAMNPSRATHLRRGDEVLVPAVCWSTSLWPLIQYGLVPVLVDSDPETLNMSLADARRRVTSRTRGLMAVHVLGNSAPMSAMTAFVREHGLLLIEDTCESLSSKADGRALGTLGSFGTFSFYYSHHITTGEGGMVVCSSAEDYDLLKCLRAHGWSRELSNRAALEAKHPDIDPRFLFVNAGFNLRPLEVQAAIGNCQLDRLDDMSAARNSNRARLAAAIEAHPDWHGQFAFAAASPGTAPVWFGFPLMISDGRDRTELLQKLTGRGVENRPIISGNFARQPGLALFGIDVDPLDYPGAEQIHQQGFFIGLRSAAMDDETVRTLAHILVTT